MIPPTPTPIPYNAPPVALEFDGVLLWDVAPNAVGFWGQFGDYTPVLQWIIVGMLVIALVWLIAGLFKQLSQDEA
jgi:hypothetical protein